MASASRRRFLAGLGAAALCGVARAEDELVLSNGRVLVGDGTSFRGGVRVRGGVVVETGMNVTGGFDLAGGTLYPGVYDAGVPLGLYEIDLEGNTHDESESSDAITPQARVVDGYNPASALIPVARLGGVMGALVTPSPGTLVPGQAAWMRTTGDTVAEATLREPAGILLSMGHAATGGAPNSPRSRMGVVMKLRDLFDANPPPKAPEAPKKGRAEPAAEEKPPTRFQAAIHALLKRETKAIFVADRADDLLAALDLARAYQLDAVILGGAEGHVVARSLADARVPVLLGPVTVQPGNWSTLRASYENAARLHAAGVRFAFRSGSPHNSRDLVTQAGIAVAYGLPFDAAITALCGGPSLWGLPQGRIVVGQEATFVWTDGDPLQPRTAVRGIWSRGRALPLESRQTRLYERFRTLE